jgi:hypothetical protein
MFQKLKKELKSLGRTNLDTFIADKFWIQDATLHQRVRLRTKEKCCFNHQIGLPSLPGTLQLMDLMPYQIEFAQLVQEGVHRMYHINKSRQIGVTELILRILAFHSFHKYKGSKILIITGTREKTAKKIMSRFKTLFKNIPEVIESSHALKMTFTNGTEIEALPSNSEAIRGDTKIGAIFVDEAVHFKLLDDSIVMDAIKPIVFTNKADLFLVSTPNGRRGFFYNISEGQNEYHKVKWDYTVAIGFIYGKDEIEKELQSVDANVDQEYRCKFTTSHSTIFTEEMLNSVRDEEHKTTDLRVVLGYG